MRIYYNSACPVCKAGIESERCRLDAEGVTHVEWLDVHAQPERAAEVGTELERVRERLHVTTPDGKLHVGIDAFAALFAQQRRRRWLASALRLPIVHGLAALAYNLFARALYRWNRRRGHW